MYIGVGETYKVALDVLDEFNAPIVSDVVVATIKDRNSGLNYNGLFWQETGCEIMVPHIGNGRYGFDFKVEEQSVFDINIFSKKFPIAKSFVIESFEKVEVKENTYVKITSKNFRYQDGSDTIILSENGNPLAGVKISCYNPDNKEVIAVTQSDSFGEWSMIIPKGKSFFIFEKDGYATVSFERTVL